MDVLDKVNKFPWGRLQNMTPHDAYIIPIHVRIVTLAGISHEQKGYNTVIEQTGK